MLIKGAITQACNSISLLANQFYKVTYIMKNNKFIKFSLTVACAAVLAACGSSGGSNNAAAEEAAKQQAAAEKAAEAKLETGNGAPNVGGKFVKKTQSNLYVGEDTNVDNKSSTKVTSMTEELHPSLDTVVVAIPLDSTKAPQAYLEDFDFRGNTANTSGTHTLEHIYKTVDGSTTVGDVRKNGEASTKTDTKGKDTGVAYVYEQDRLNYTRKPEGKNVVDTKDARTDARLAGSVAEVYGHRTFVDGDSEVKNIADGDTVLANAPFTAKTADGKYTAGSKLNYVQYGRVTSRLHAVNENNLKAGKDVAQFGTKVASYGGYAENGTEDNYFFRGVNNTSAEQLSALPGYYDTTDFGGKLHYQGHAVTYNLDKDFKLGAGLPNALGAEYALVSGTHVAADIDLASQNVTGNLYNVWKESNTQQQEKEHNVQLATFEGNLANDGSIVGTATKYDDTKGTLKASLYGSKAQELGGAIASNDTTNNWGASFGAKVQNPEYVAPTQTQTQTPTPTPTPAWGERTEEVKK